MTDLLKTDQLIDELLLRHSKAEILELIADRINEKFGAMEKDVPEFNEDEQRIVKYAYIDAFKTALLRKGV